MNQPSNIEAEQSVLAAILNFKDAYGEVADMLTEDHFYDPKHQAIFKTMAGLDMEGEPIESITITNRNSKIELSWLAELKGIIISTANIKHHAKIVYDNYIKRMLIMVADKAIQQCKSGGEAKEISDELAESLFALNPASQKSDPTWIADILPEVLKQIEENSQSKSGITGLPWPWIDINNSTAGLHKGDLTVIAGRPGMGKTVAGLNICQNLAIQQHICLFISAEMQKEQLVMRCIASEAKINGHHLRAGKVESGDRLKISQIAGRMSEWNLIIDDSSRPSLPGIMNIARRIEYKYGLGLICIDQLGLLNLPKGDNLHQQLGNATKGLKAMAKDMNIPIIAIHQLTKDVDKRKTPRPQLADLRESGNIEEDADNVLLIYRPEVYEIKRVQGPQGSIIDTENLVEIIIAKQRNGPTSTQRLTFKKPYLMFADYAKED